MTNTVEHRTSKKKFNLWTGNTQAHEVLYDFITQMLPRYSEAPWGMVPNQDGLRGRDWKDKMAELAAAMNYHFKLDGSGKSYSSGGVEIQLAYALQQGINSKGYRWRNDQEWRKKFTVTNLTHALDSGFMSPCDVHPFGLEWLGKYGDNTTVKRHFPKLSRQELMKAGEVFSETALPIREKKKSKQPKQRVMKMVKSSKTPWLEGYYARKDWDTQQIKKAIVNGNKFAKDSDDLIERAAAEEAVQFFKSIVSGKTKVELVPVASVSIVPGVSQHRKQNHSSQEKRSNKDTIAERGVDIPLLGIIKNANSRDVVVLNGCHRTEISKELVAGGKLPPEFKLPMWLITQQQYDRWKCIATGIQAWLNRTSAQALLQSSDVAKYAREQFDKSGFDPKDLPTETGKLRNLPVVKKIRRDALNHYGGGNLTNQSIRRAVTDTVKSYLKSRNDGITNFDEPRLQSMLENQFGFKKEKDSDCFTVATNAPGPLQLRTEDRIMVNYIANQKGTGELQTYVEKVARAKRMGRKSVLVMHDQGHKGEESALIVEMQRKWNEKKKYYFMIKNAYGSENGVAVYDYIVVPNQIDSDTEVLIGDKKFTVVGRDTISDPVLVTKSQAINWFESPDPEVPLAFMCRVKK